MYRPWIYLPCNVFQFGSLNAQKGAVITIFWVFSCLKEYANWGFTGNFWPICFLLFDPTLHILIKNLIIINSNTYQHNLTQKYYFWWHWRWATHLFWWVSPAVAVGEPSCGGGWVQLWRWLSPAAAVVSPAVVVVEPSCSGGEPSCGGGWAQLWRWVIPAVAVVCPAVAVSEPSSDGGPALTGS